MGSGNIGRPSQREVNPDPSPQEITGKGKSQVSHANETKNRSIRDAFKGIASSFQKGGKKIFSMKRGGAAEDMWVKIKTRFSSNKANQTHTQVRQDGSLVHNRFDYRKADCSQIAAYMQARTEGLAGQGGPMVSMIFLNQGDRYGVYNKLYLAAEMLKIAGGIRNAYPAADEMLDALKAKIEAIPEEKRSKQLRELLSQIEGSPPPTN